MVFCIRTKLVLFLCETLVFVMFLKYCDGQLGITFEKLTANVLKHADLYFVTDDSSVENTILPHSSIFQLSYKNDSFSINNDNQPTTFKIVVALNSTEKTLQILREIGMSNIYKSHVSQIWILVFWPTKIGSNTLMEETLNSIPLETAQLYAVNSELHFAFLRDDAGRAAENEDITFYELYTINNQIVMKNITNFGETFDHCEECDTFTTRRKDFLGLILKVVGVEDREANDDTTFGIRNGEISLEDGYSVRIWRLIAAALNFTMKAVKTDEWGKYSESNNSWYGAIDDVLTGKVDVCISETAMSPHRAQFISFLPSVSENIVSAFFKTPDLNAIRDIFAQPFKADLWAAVIATWIVLASLMIIFSLIRKRFEIGDADSEPDFTQDSFICALAMACQQGWDEHPTAGSLRTIFISGSFTGVVAYAGYSAAIVSTLSLRIDPIQSPSALLQSNLRLGIRDGFVLEILQQTTIDDILSKFYGRLSKRKDEQMLNITAGYERLQQHPFAFISLQDAFYDTVKVMAKTDEICALKELTLIQQRFPGGPFLPKNSPYQEFLRYMILYIREPGILWRLKSEYSFTRRCLEASDNTGRALGANDVFTAFMILIGGYMLSTTFLVIEKLFIVAPFSYIS